MGSKWEYAVETPSELDIDRAGGERGWLAKYGEVDWELVAVIPFGALRVYYFKRPRT